MNDKRNTGAGFSLIELMVTIAILAIVTSLAAPALGTFVSRSAMRGISADFTLAMQRARSEAINRNECVAICMSSNNTTCTTTGSNWGVGWIVFRSPTCEIVAPTAADIHLVQQAINTRYVLNSVSTVRRSVIFNPRGNSRSVGASFNLKDTKVSSNDTINRTFCLDFAGRITTLEYASTCS